MKTIPIFNSIIVLYKIYTSYDIISLDFQLFRIEVIQMSFFKENYDRIDITEKEFELMELLDNVGVNYRRVVEPVKISIL